MRSQESHEAAQEAATQACRQCSRNMHNMKVSIQDTSSSWPQQNSKNTRQMKAARSSCTAALVKLQMKLRDDCLLYGMSTSAANAKSKNKARGQADITTSVRRKRNQKPKP